MGASVNAWIVPGRTISSFGAPRSGVTTATAGTAISRVSCVTTASARVRVVTPHTTAPTAIWSATAPRIGPLLIESPSWLDG